MLFNEPKLLKYKGQPLPLAIEKSFSALQRAEIAEMRRIDAPARPTHTVSVLFNEPKLLKSRNPVDNPASVSVSVLFNEPKLLKFETTNARPPCGSRFSALQRAEIAEIGSEEGEGGRKGEFQCSSTSRNC